MLTPRQKELFDFIERYLTRKGYAPTQEEMAGKLGISSLGTLQKHIKHLVAKGRLRKIWNGKRAIELVEKRAGGGVASSALPLLGYVAAGSPIEAIEGNDEIEVPPSMLGHGESFVLQVKGHSMVEDGILDGDYVVVRRQETAQNGQTVVALLDNEATVKRFFKRGREIELRPANSAYKAKIVRAGDLKVRGIVVGVIRKCT